MSLDNTVSELIQRVRDITDESNTSDINDPLVMRMLNRAQQEMVRTLTRHYKNHFMREEVFTSSDLVADVNGQSRIVKVADQSFGFAVNAVDGKIGTSWFPINQVPFSYTLGYDNTTTGGLPLSYAMQGQKIFLYPAPSSGVEIRVRYQFRAPQLVAPQGRITASTSSTLTLDALGSGLSTSVDTLGAFINIVDHLTGEIKATMQVTGGIGSTDKTIDVQTDADTLAGVRTEVFGYTTTATMPTNISKDDYVCSASGTCVPLLAHDLTNYLVDIASFYIKRKLGTVESADFADREEIMKAIKGMQFGRQYTKKIKRSQGIGGYSWNSFFRGS